MSPNYLDYLAIVVSVSSGITNDTVIFLKMAFAMELPIIVIVTKIDFLPEEDQLQFLNQLNYVIKKECRSNRNPLVTRSQEDIVMFSRIMKESIVPIFLVSNKTGSGLDLFINFLNILPDIKTSSQNDSNSTVQVSLTFIYILV